MSPIGMYLLFPSINLWGILMTFRICLHFFLGTAVFVLAFLSFLLSQLFFAVGVFVFTFLFLLARMSAFSFFFLPQLSLHFYFSFSFWHCCSDIYWRALPAEMQINCAPRSHSPLPQHITLNYFEFH